MEKPSKIKEWTQKSWENKGKWCYKLCTNHVSRGCFMRRWTGISTKHIQYEFVSRLRIYPLMFGNGTGFLKHGNPWELLVFLVFATSLTSSIWTHKDTSGLQPAKMGFEWGTGQLVKTMQGGVPWLANLVNTSPISSGFDDTYIARVHGFPLGLYIRVHHWGAPTCGESM